MKHYTITVREPIFGVREYTVEKQFKTNSDLIDWMKKLANQDSLPEEIMDFENEMIFEDERPAFAINGAMYDFPGIQCEVGEIEFRHDTSMQRAFTWTFDGQMCTYHPLGRQQGAISANVVIAKPIDSPDPGEYAAGPSIGSRFKYNGRVWMVVFAFESPE